MLHIQQGNSLNLDLKHRKENDMTKEDKQLLLANLCARLPYGVKYQTYLGDIFTLKDIALSRTSTQYYIDDNAFSLEQIKPYLRPMSSMTNDEEETYESFIISIAEDETGAWELTDWLNEHHFDYRGLIPMGLAVAVTEENNPYKQ